MHRDRAKIEADLSKEQRDLLAAARRHGEVLVHRVNARTHGTPRVGSCVSYTDRSVQALARKGLLRLVARRPYCDQTSMFVYQPA